MMPYVVSRLGALGIVGIDGTEIIVEIYVMVLLYTMEGASRIRCQCFVVVVLLRSDAYRLNMYVEVSAAKACTERVRAVFRVLNLISN